MSDYVTPEIDPADDDPAAILEDKIELLQDRIPGLELQDADPFLVMLEASAVEEAETRRAAKETFDTIARWFGETVFSFPPLDAIPASGASTWTVTHDDGYLIAAGIQITLESADGSRVGFEVVEDVEIPNGNTATSAGEVLLIAVEDGTVGNDLSGDPRPEELLDALDSIVIVGTTSGGQDAETETEYLNRFARRQRLVSPHLIKPADFEAFAQDWTDDTYGQPVARARVLDLYNPADGTSSNEGMVTVVPVDENGAALSSGAKTALQEAMEDLLITGFVVNVADPNFTVITVSFTATAYPGYDPSAVEAAAEAAVADRIHPANHGLPKFGDVAMWLDEPKVRMDDLYETLGGVEGLWHVTALTINGGTSDVTLPVTNANPAGLPDDSSTVSGTVTAS